MKLVWSEYERELLLRTAKKYLDAGQRVNWPEVQLLFYQRNLKYIKEQLYNLLRASRRDGSSEQYRFNHKWSEDEEGFLGRLVGEYGTNWSAIAGYFADKTVNQLKNKYYSMVNRCYPKSLSEDQMIAKIGQLIAMM